MLLLNFPSLGNGKGFLNCASSLNIETPKLVLHQIVTIILCYCGFRYEIQ